MEAWVENMRTCRKETTAFQKATEANPEEIQSEAVHREVPKEEAAEKSSGVLKKRHRGRHLAAGRRSQPEGKTRGNCGSRKEFAAARRGMTRRAGVARRKGRGRQRQNKDNVAPRT
jgi:hypothetical protein